ncbi:MAG: carbon-nitrogen hydrolase family protein [Geminicoccaceae bacterium]|nr:carbon-nitrogen hydrolase family protein [Geminicoccaceae bacterium]MCS7267313.1 carbon-nitrogen hydrolase family protein [Geminicoccaceae bacterium]MCX7628629.1 carbon-nitrogen hydrolase family protein [Geminicoccaceae bacterium]MDW8125078.1 carbon-nitrogen hydrolase family protein [Geminicoccaceae bacterium]MDW8340634.1 carbon-nitrogen hydrolase family protein [Geminicoccaceae bacterium]
MRISVVQMNAGEDKAANLAAAERLVKAAVREDRPDLVVLPEVWTCMGGGETTKRAAAEVLGEEGEAWRLLRDLARGHRIWLHGGSLLERDPREEKLFNTTVVFDRDGREVARYRKIHLFDITAPDGREYRESATFGRGREIVVYEAEGLKVGCSICYDVRFGELYRRLADRGAELLVVPAAFTLHTGKDHWEVLLRARAIETQCYLAAAAQWGPHRAGNEERWSYGHSLVVDPWGLVVARASEGEGFATARIDRARIAQVRSRIPVHAHRVLPG